jgi:hypothetical protein
MVKKIKIAFGGKMRVGKDTAVKYCKSKVVSSDHFSFAEPIYEIMRFAQKKANLKYEKDRKFLQYIGTEWGRSKDENIWIDILLEKSANSKKDYIFVSDLRFENEFNMLKKNGWICVKIQKKHNKIYNKHISEHSLSNIADSEWDFIINNDDSLQKFYEEISKILELNN